MLTWPLCFFWNYRIMLNQLKGKIAVSLQFYVWPQCLIVWLPNHSLALSYNSRNNNGRANSIVTCLNTFTRTGKCISIFNAGTLVEMGNYDFYIFFFSLKEEIFFWFFYQYSNLNIIYIFSRYKSNTLF